MPSVVTQMQPQWILDLWGDLPANDTSGVARALLLPAVRPELNGRTIWVAGNEGVEVEEALQDSQARWLGERLSEAVNEGQKRMGVKNSY